MWIHAFNQRGLTALDPHWAGGATPPHRRRRRSRGSSSSGAPTPPPVRLFVHPVQHPQARRVPAGPLRPSRPEARYRPGRSRSGGSGCGRSWPATTSPSNAPGPGRSPPTRATRPNWTASNRSPPIPRTGASRSTSSGRCRSAPATAPAGPPRNHPDRLRATYKRTHGIRYLHGCYDLLNDKLWGVLRRRKGADHTLAAFKNDPGRPPGRGTDLRHPATTCRRTRPPRSAPGRRSTRSSCA